MFSRSKYQVWRVVGVVVVFFLSSLVFLPAHVGLADDEAPDEVPEVLFTIEEGVVEVVEDDMVVVNGITIAPAGAFDPSDLSVGDTVTITGYFLHDGTLQAVSPEADETDAGESDTGRPDDVGPPDHAGRPDDVGPPDHAGRPDDVGPPDHAGRPDDVGPPDHAGRPDDTDAPGNEAEDDDAETAEGCVGTAEHPVGTALATAFEQDYETVMSWFCDGDFGFGEITLALAMAEQLEGVEAGDLLDLKAGGEGWGKIMKMYDVHPRDLRRVRMGGAAGEPGETGRPDDAGRPENPGGGRGKP